MQMFDTLMLRQTTKVTVSPTSSARSSSAASRISSIASGRVSANSAVSSSSLERRAGAALVDRAGDEVAADHPIVAATRSAARDERPVARRDHVEHALRDPLAARCSARYTHSRSVSATPSCARRRRTWCGEGNGCSGEMWSPLAESPPRSLAPAATSSGHQSERFGGTWMPTSGSSSRACSTSSRRSSIVTSQAHSGSG